jgi:hypothetical protein
VTTWVSTTVSLAQAAHVIDYMRRAGVPVRATGSGSFMPGSSAHLAMLVELVRTSASRRGSK